MPPQPLSSVNKNAVVKWGTQYAFERNPNLAILAMRVIAGWAHADSFMQSVLIKMLGARAEPAARMFTALNSSNAKIDALSAVARSVLVPENLEMFEAIMMVTRPAARARHRLAHDLWCYSDDLPDALLLLDATANFDFTLQQAIFRLQNPMVTLVEGRTAPTFPKDRVFVYRERDLEEIKDQVSNVGNFWALFHDIAMLNPTLPVPNFRELELEPQIKEALARLRKQSGNAP